MSSWLRVVYGTVWVMFMTTSSALPRVSLYAQAPGRPVETSCDATRTFKEWRRWSPQAGAALIFEEFHGQLSRALTKQSNNVGSSSNAQLIRALMASFLESARPVACSARRPTATETCRWVRAAGEREKVTLDEASVAILAALLSRILDSHTPARLCALDRLDRL